MMATQIQRPKVATWDVRTETLSLPCALRWDQYTYIYQLDFHNSPTHLLSTPVFSRPLSKLLALGTCMHAHATS